MIRFCKRCGAGWSFATGSTAFHPSPVRGGREHCCADTGMVVGRGGRLRCSCVGQRLHWVCPSSVYLPQQLSSCLGLTETGPCRVASDHPFTQIVLKMSDFFPIDRHHFPPISMGSIPPPPPLLLACNASNVAYFCRCFKDVTSRHAACMLGGGAEANITGSKAVAASC